MADLDTSHHTLNTSTSKQKFSFPKTERFRPPKLTSDSYYEIPTTRTSRVTSLGYGKKDIGIRVDKCIPPIGTYDLSSSFKKDEKVGFGFGKGRQQMELGGPFKDSKLQSYIPGPGRYDSNKSMLDERSSSLRSRLPDVSTRHLLKNPGPGAYGYQQLGKGNYYMTSKFRNDTNHKIAPGTRRTSFISKAPNDVGPGSYTINVEDLNPQGKYLLSNHESSKSRPFSKSTRQGLVYKHMLNTPGPGQYPCFSSFG